MGVFFKSHSIGLAVVRAIALVVFSSGLSRALADEHAGPDFAGVTPSDRSVSADAMERDYYAAESGIDWNEPAADTQPVDLMYESDSYAPGCSLGLGCSGKGLSYDPGRPQKPHRKLPGDINRGDCPPYRYTLSDCQRAGDPHCVAWWAKPSTSLKYSAGFVGGGAAIGGRSRHCSEGVWGMDYHGLFPYRRVWMRWTCGREQGGVGAYKTDGHTGPLAKH